MYTYVYVCMYICICICMCFPDVLAPLQQRLHDAVPDVLVKHIYIYIYMYRD